MGTPLNEDLYLSPEAIACLKSVEVVIGENRKQLHRYLRSIPEPRPFQMIYLDPERPEEVEAWRTALKERKVTALLLDTGMPCLFDPGVEILRFARKEGFTIRSCPSATSWGTAAAVSGFAPPFTLVGFPPRKTEDREQAWKKLSKTTGNLVLLETPYRFPLLLDELPRYFPASREVFLAWEIARPTEHFWWGSLSELPKWAEKNALKKGEFILILANSDA